MMFNEEALPDGQREGGLMVPGAGLMVPGAGLRVPGAGLRRSGGVKLIFVSFVRSVFVCFNQTAQKLYFHDLL